jgi:hypothetical protein
MKQGLLFVDPPEEEQKQPKGRGRKKPKEEPPELPPDPVSLQPSQALDPFAGLGQSDGQFECFRCSGGFFEIMQDDGSHWHLWCVYCGARQWEPAPERSEDDSFVFTDGRFPGMTVHQIAAQEGGRDYLAFMAKKSKSTKIKSVCQKWLDRQAVAP